MGIYFMGSSSIVKRYAEEVGSSWIVRITDSAASNEIYVVRITGVEVVSALTRLNTADDTEDLIVENPNTIA